jgi:glycosyltransferase involved in cell wall biosynthesis
MSGTRFPGSGRESGSFRKGPKRLAFVTSTPLSVAGGSGTYVGIRQLFRSLGDWGVEVRVHAPTFWCPSFTAKRFLFNLLEAPRLRRGPYDWVVGFDLDGFHYGRDKAAPYIACIKGVIADELRNERGFVRTMLAIQASFERSAVRRADVVVATSLYSRDRIVEAYGIPASKVRIIPEPIDLQAWTWEETGAIDPRPGPPAILSVAHMYPRKNLDILLEAYAHLRDAGIPFRGWIVGEGPCRARWESQRDALGLEQQVEFLGTVSRRDLEDRYRRATLFCLPSRQEGFGIVFLEAMACGKPIVAGRRAAVPETVSDGETGLLVDPDDPAELAEALAKLLLDGELCRAMGVAGRRRVEQYDASRVAATFLTTIRAALEDIPRQSVSYAAPEALPSRGGHPARIAGTGGGR